MYDASCFPFGSGSAFATGPGAPPAGGRFDDFSFSCSSLDRVFRGPKLDVCEVSFVDFCDIGIVRENPNVSGLSTNKRFVSN